MLRRASVLCAGLPKHSDVSQDQASLQPPLASSSLQSSQPPGYVSPLKGSMSFAHTESGYILSTLCCTSAWTRLQDAHYLSHCRNPAHRLTRGDVYDRDMKIEQALQAKASAEHAVAELQTQISTLRRKLSALEAQVCMHSCMGQQLGTGADVVNTAIAKGLSCILATFSNVSRGKVLLLGRGIAYNAACPVSPAANAIQAMLVA